MEERIKRKPGVLVLTGQAVLACLIEYGSALLNRYAVGHDGKTAYERLRGKKSRTIGLRFGELVQ